MQRRFCRYCGARLAQGAAFCESCGRQIQGERPARQQPGQGRSAALPGQTARRQAPARPSGPAAGAARRPVQSRRRGRRRSRFNPLFIAAAAVVVVLAIVLIPRSRSRDVVRMPSAELLAGLPTSRPGTGTTAGSSSRAASQNTTPALSKLMIESFTKSVLTKNNQLSTVLWMGDYHINDIQETHDSYGRYIVTVQYDASDGQSYVGHTAYLYFRYYEEEEGIHFYPELRADQPLGADFRAAVNWGSYTPRQADTDGLQAYLRGATEEPADEEDPFATDEDVWGDDDIWQEDDTAAA